MIHDPPPPTTTHPPTHPSTFPVFLSTLESRPNTSRGETPILLDLLRLPLSSISLHFSRLQALQPVLQVLGILEKNVIRCLLASMPPGCVIPVHHDTGHWVQHTHRIHVAVTTDVAEVGCQLVVLIVPFIDRIKYKVKKILPQTLIFDSRRVVSLLTSQHLFSASKVI